MALVRNWRKVKARGPIVDIMNECKSLNLKGCDMVTIKFDPFRKDVSEIRHFSFLLHSFSALKTNLALRIKTEILTDRSEQTVTVNLVNGETILMKCAHLTAVDIFRFMNKYVTPLAPQDSIAEKQKTSKITKSLRQY